MEEGNEVWKCLLPLENPHLTNPIRKMAQVGGTSSQIRSDSNETPNPITLDGNNTNGIAQKKGGDTSRLIKLISVRLKEAALDSPSFRAGFYHYNSKIDLTEQWIDGLIKSTKKYPQQYNDFKDVNSVFLNQLMPDFLKSGLIDQENTSSVLETTRTNLESLWSKAFQDLDVNSNEIIELLTELTKTHIKKYKDTRKNFEFIQSKYDNALSKYASLAKTKEPSASREDAFQLFDIRKSYLASSLEMCIDVSKIHQVLDIALLKLSELIFQGKDASNEKYFSKVNAWSDAINSSVESLLADMSRSKEQINKATILQFEPTRDLKQHNLALLNPQTLTQFDPQIDNPDEEFSYEKHGWLFMKTTVGKPARQIWVRRWVFVKTGIFGMFSLAPTKNFVQETDKIGVLLCNIRYAPDEDRRFCFEIKTIESTVVLQAETLKELRSWLRVFSQEKQRAIDNSQSDSGKYAFGRYPPLLYEFASTSLTSVDMELTSSKVENANRDDTVTTVTSSYLSSLIEQIDGLELNNTSNTSDFRDPDLNTPIATAKSKTALLCHAFLSPTVVPTAVTANIWGSVNWGMYYMTDYANKHVNQIKAKENNLSSLNTMGVYPSYYPAHLKQYDIQLKSLFDTTVGRDELVLVHFTCLWSLNPGQELSGSCFITNKNSYIYLNSTGFVSLMRKPLAELVAIDVVTEKNWDLMKVYDIEGLNMKGRIFLEDGKLIQKKVDLLINNISKEEPKGQEEIIGLIEAMRSDDSSHLDRQASKATHHRPLSALSSHPQELNSIQPFDGMVAENKSMRTNFKQDYEMCQVQSFNVPAKALFHIMYGDHSSLFRDTASYIDTDDYRTSPWYTKDGKLVRYIDFKLNISRSLINLQGTQGNISSRRIQTIEEMIDNKYYRINEVGNSSKVFGTTLRLSKKFVIVEENAKSCKLLIYARVDFTEKNFKIISANICKKSVFHFHKQEILNSFTKIQELVEKLGNHGKIIKSIRTYGNLSKSNEPFPDKPDIIFLINFNLVVKYYAKILMTGLSMIIFRITRFAFIDIVKLFEDLSVHRLLLLLLFASVFLNFFLSGRSTVAFWTTWRSENTLINFAKDLELRKIERSLTLDEVDVLSSINFNNSSPPFEKYLTSNGVRDPTTAEVDLRFREAKHQLAVKRNELLVELKILEKVEKELVFGNYKNFLLSELTMCNIAFDQVKDDLLTEYCATCVDELKKLTSSNLL